MDKEQQIAAAFQIRSVPTVFLVKDGQIVDGFPGALPEGQLREFLASHGVQPAEAAEAQAEEIPLDPQQQVAALREAVAAEPDKDELKLDLVLALLKTGEAAEAERLLDALPANLATDDRAVKARARLGFAAALKDAPAPESLRAAIAANADDLRARHLLASVAVPAANFAGFRVDLSKATLQLEDKLPPNVLEALRRFSVAANRSTGATYPRDQDRWFDFIIQAHRSGTELDASTLARWLSESDGWPEDGARELGG